MINKISLLSIAVITSFLIGCGGGDSTALPPSVGTNNEPTINTTFSNFSLLENNGTNSYDVNISDIDGDNLTLSIESNNTNILSVNKNFTNPLLQADYKNKTLDFNLTTVQDAFGIVKITITVDDGDKNSTKSFDINVTEVATVFQSGDTWKGLEYNTTTSPNTYTNDINVTINGVTKTYPAGTQRVWLDRNLGASQVCTAFDDTACYGDYYQWGRNTDGHQESNSTITVTLATDTNVTNQNIVDNNGSFIKNGSAPYDWVADGVDNNGSIRSGNWSKIDGTSICPVGYRVPTEAELTAETTGLSGANNVQNRDDAFNSFLKLPSAGSRGYNSGSLYDQGSWGYVWSSSVDGSYSRMLFFDSGVAFWTNGYRSSGLSVRCVRD